MEAYWEDCWALHLLSSIGGTGAMLQPVAGFQRLRGLARAVGSALSGFSGHGCLG